ncbi:hypothetical protein ACGVWT_16450, partial [Sphingomonas sp. S6]
THRQASSLDHRDEGSLFDADHPATGVPFPRRSTNDHTFHSLAVAKRIIKACRTGYDIVRPHSSFGGIVSAEFSNRPAQGTSTPKLNYLRPKNEKQVTLSLDHVGDARIKPPFDGHIAGQERNCHASEK